MVRSGSITTAQLRPTGIDQALEKNQVSIHTHLTRSTFPFLFGFTTINHLITNFIVDLIATISAEEVFFKEHRPRRQ